jgi:F-type H+-transporting ATPase subunit alpha
VELFKQHQYSPKPLEIEVAVLWAMQNGHFDDVDVDRVKECQNALEEYLSNRKADILQLIADEKVLSDEIIDGLKQAVSDFKSTWK